MVTLGGDGVVAATGKEFLQVPALKVTPVDTCLLYTSDAADERSSVDLGGRRIIKKKKIAERGHITGKPTQDQE